MSFVVEFLLFTLALLLVVCDAKVISDESIIDKCEMLPPETLANVLGSAYNRRYMSIEMPADIERTEYTVSSSVNKLKRNVSNSESFYVNSTYSAVLSDKPAWEMIHVEHDYKKRNKRSFGALSLLTDEQRAKELAYAAENERRETEERPWNCDGRIKWIDLGKDYFPRYLRSIECHKQTCWYGHYTCVARSFTLKVLHRRRGLCTGQVNEMRELWVWEERAINFCCDCVLRY